MTAELARPRTPRRPHDSLMTPYVKRLLRHTEVAFPSGDQSPCDPGATPLSRRFVPPESESDRLGGNPPVNDWQP